MHNELSLYLQGSKQSSILLCGQPGLPLIEDARNAAATMLRIEPGRLELHPDYLFINSGNEKTIGVDKAALIINKSMFKPSIADKIICLIDGMNSMTEQAQNKLLKLIEESQNIYIIATAYSSNVIDTIRSRMRVISYRPLNKQQFIIWCQENQKCDASILYYVCGGCPGLIDEYTSVVCIMRDILNCLNEGDFIRILSVLHLVKEKDKDNFFLQYPSLVTNLYSMIGNFVNQLVVSKSELYKCDSLFKCMNYIHNAMVRCTSISYTKDNFFLDMVSIIETMKGGRL